MSLPTDEVKEGIAGALGVALSDVEWAVDSAPIEGRWTADADTDEWGSVYLRGSPGQLFFSVGSLNMSCDVSESDPMNLVKVLRRFIAAARAFDECKAEA
jgi:hypothetical protein